LRPANTSPSWGRPVPANRRCSTCSACSTGPSSGRYRLDGRDVTDLTEAESARVRREKIGFVFQFFHLVPRLTAAANVALPLLLAGVAAAERKQRVAQLLADVGLSERAEHLPSQLSGGQLQRVAIARAMSMHPALLLADEPTGNLDRATGREVMACWKASTSAAQP
jgi:putative ABC transport system ATP-binding protein